MVRTILKALVPHRVAIAGRLAAAPQMRRIPLVAVPRAADLLDRLVTSYGYGRAIVENAPVNAAGAPIPWYTYPMVEYLESIDFSAMTVFEYGCGNSTLWWSARARQVVSVENDPAWHDRVSKSLPQNARVLLEPDPARYVQAIRPFGSFDVIIVDGIERYACSVEAVQHLSDGGAIILDNADCLPDSTLFLRNAGLLEVAMNGFTPLLSRASRTSLFLSQPSRLTLRAHRPALAGTDENWDADPGNTLRAAAGLTAVEFSAH